MKRLTVGHAGHYVVICDYEGDRDCFVLRDPGTPEGCQVRVQAACLDAARKASGTDEDLLLVKVPEHFRQRAQQQQQQQQQFAQQLAPFKTTGVSTQATEGVRIGVVASIVPAGLHPKQLQELFSNGSSYSHQLVGR